MHFKSPLPENRDHSLVVGGGLGHYFFEIPTGCNIEAIIGDAVSDGDKL